MAKRILVPLDMTREAEAVIPVVADTARGAWATVCLLHVAPIPDNVVNDDGLTVAYADQEMVRLDAEARDYLKTIELHFEPVPVEIVVRFGDPAREILEEAAAFGADLIAVTTTRRSALGRRLLGSVAEKIVRVADTSVMLVRAADV